MIWNVTQVRIDQGVDLRLILPYSIRRDLLMITYDNRFVGKIEWDKSIKVGLTRLVDDHHIKACRGCLKVLCN